ncbi:ABC transporter ATP-binding protein [Xanthomonas sp. LMG 12462]|uniref:ABC transporter ATP-binding protein n=1 Tax=Xanthomonas sp. LMG 12462 TaxID=1591134 RepID=UPI001264F102|nr:ABC transporter ATP-binding protein [Xanthomonas sp. LMG 12462]KAB7767686.1 teichoic acid ABC transporter ATP-binding protein [Xanthomonas sp. LMG 12462]
MSTTQSAVTVADGDAAIQVLHVVKDYPVYASARDRLFSLLKLSGDSASRTFRALDNVSLVVPKGETVGIIGRNGAGKSTLLQILCGTVQPTSGSVSIKGRFAALLELGAGFNPDFSGRDNVYLSASLLGLSRKEVDDKLESIIAFADIGDFFDRPVKTYSSGMYVRLAFSVAIHTEPDVLIIDEALSVGDIRFQMKCLARIEQIRARGATILFVSHSLEQVKRFCQTALWLEGGKVKLHGEASFVADRFRDYELSKDQPASPDTQNRQAPASSSVPAHIETVALSTDMLAPFEPLTVEISYAVRDESVDGLLLGVAIKGMDGLHIFGPNTHLERVRIPTSRGSHRVSYHIPSMTLLTGSYRVDVGLFTDKGLVCVDYISEASVFTVAAPYFSEGVVYISHEWKVHESDAS